MTDFKIPKDVPSMRVFLEKIEKEDFPVIGKREEADISLMKLLTHIQEKRFLAEYHMSPDEQRKLDAAKESIGQFHAIGTADKELTLSAIIVNLTPSRKGKDARGLLKGISTDSNALTDAIGGISTIREYIQAYSNHLQEEIARLQRLKPNTKAYKAEEQRIKAYFMDRHEARTIDNIIQKQKQGMPDDEVVDSTGAMISSIPNMIRAYQGSLADYQNYDAMAEKAGELLQNIANALEIIASSRDEGKNRRS